MSSPRHDRAGAAGCAARGAPVGLTGPPRSSSTGASLRRGARHAPPSTSRARASGRTPHSGHERWRGPRAAALTSAAGDSAARAAATPTLGAHTCGEDRRTCRLVTPSIWAASRCVSRRSSTRSIRSPGPVPRRSSALSPSLQQYRRQKEKPDISILVLPCLSLCPTVDPASGP